MHLCTHMFAAQGLGEAAGGAELPLRTERAQVGPREDL